MTPPSLGGCLASWSQELRNGDKVCLLEIFKPWTYLIEILSQVEHLLRDLNYVFLLGLGNLNQWLHDCCSDQILALKLLTDLEGNVEGTNSHQGRFASWQFIVMHWHLGKIHGHFVDQKEHALWCVTVRGQILLLFLGDRESSIVVNVQHLLQIDP